MTLNGKESSARSQVKDISVEVIKVYVDFNTCFFLLRHLFLSHLRLAFIQMLRPFLPELVMFSDFEFRTTLGTSSQSAGHFKLA